jgi:hypothetical protein
MIEAEIEAEIEAAGVIGAEIEARMKYMARQGPSLAPGFPSS